ncbi:MAG: RNA polymerase factor sigma-54 [Planctomycetota bacterium]|jgi:RNA polymerase sigma-54 factor
MRFDTSQHMKLGQKMKLAPRMIQSMEILQMPMLALQERIEQELESNVVLEQVEPGLDQEAVKDEEEASNREETMGERELVVGEDSPTGSDDFERLSTFESSYGEALDSDFKPRSHSAARASGERDRKMDAMASIAARGESLTEQLLHQWALAEVNGEAATIGELLIGYIDADGLLGESLETILEQNRDIPGVTLTIESLDEALRAVQFWLEPAGIGARDQREALLLQIDERERTDESAEHDWDAVRRLITDHYDDLLQNRLPRIAQKTEMSLPRIREAIDLLKKLNLSPGRDLVDEDVPPIIPDVIIEYDEELDEYLARLSDGLLPSLRISSRYRKMARDRSQDKATREFISENVDAVRQRRGTLLRVVNLVLAHQRDYFDQGRQHLRPLPMIDVAEQLGIHVATVSRAVADKWMQTPRGLVPLRMFFSGGTATDTGQQMSWEAVKATLQEIIDAEDKSRPLSDEALAAELKKRGIEIARRTVVKYRQQLDIPPARRRKVHG